MDYDSHRYLECLLRRADDGGGPPHRSTCGSRPSRSPTRSTTPRTTSSSCNADFLPILEAIRGRTRGGEGARPALRRRAAARHIPAARRRVRGAPRRGAAALRLPGGRRGHARDDLLHDRHDRPPEGRLLLPPAAGAPHARRHRRARDGRATARFRQGDVYMPITPMFHVHAWGLPYVATMLGVKQVYPGRYAPDAPPRPHRQGEGDLLPLRPDDPPHAAQDAGDREAVDLSRWKVLIGGAALPEGARAGGAGARHRRRRRATGCRETCPILSIALPRRGRPRRAGRSAQAELRLADRPDRSRSSRSRVADEERGEQPRDGRATGEIVVRAPVADPGLPQGRTRRRRSSGRAAGSTPATSPGATRAAT